MLASHRTPGRHAVRTVAATLMLLSATAATPVLAASDPGALQSKLSAAQQHAQHIRRALHDDQAKIAGYQSRIDALQQQLTPLDASLHSGRNALRALQHQLRTARANLVRLRVESAHDQHALAAQLRAQYESPRIGLVDVVVDAQGFPDLLSRVSQLRRIAAQNARVTVAVRASRRSEAAQAHRLATLSDKQRALVATETSKRDAVARLKLQVVQQQVVYVKARHAKSTRLRGLRGTQRTLEHQLDKIQREQQAAYGPVSGGTAPGGYGFFPAAGTSYAQGDEPRLAQKLGTMAHALHLHLIGLSGYRTPAHSVEVGGFANDPHTQGKASDTPGVEGVPEATLNRFGLTRPFAGAAEADHIQLVGSI